MLAVSPAWLVAKCKHEFLWFSFNNGFFCHTSIKVRFEECITNSCPVDRSSHLSYRSLQLLQSYYGLLSASLIHALLALLVSLGGQPCIGRFAVVPNSFHFQMMDLIGLSEMFKQGFIFS